MLMFSFIPINSKETYWLSPVQMQQSCTKARPFLIMCGIGNNAFSRVLDEKLDNSISLYRNTIQYVDCVSILVTLIITLNDYHQRKN